MGSTGQRTRLAEHLFFAGLSQVTASKMTGVSRQVLHDAYHGRPISLDAWLRIASGLGCSIEEIAPAEIAARIAAVA